MQKSGGNDLCCDTTDGTTGHDFELNSLQFCIHETMFCKIRDNTVAISPCWFMTDTASHFYESFVLVNECSPKQFISVWQVDKAWGDDLCGKVKNFASQTFIYKYLQISLKKKDPLVFEETERFANSFRRFWMSKKSSGASVFE